MFGPDQPVTLRLLEIPPAPSSVNGVGMELEDCALPPGAAVTAPDPGPDSLNMNVQANDGAESLVLRGISSACGASVAAMLGAISRKRNRLLPCESAGAVRADIGLLSDPGEAGLVQGIPQFALKNGYAALQQFQ
jgi:hypothetical protein